MDSRSRFLHPCMTELWGHGKEGRAGNGKTGASEGAGGQEKPPSVRQRRDAERNRVVKLPDFLSRKAAMAHTGPVP